MKGIKRRCHPFRCQTGGAKGRGRAKDSAEVLLLSAGRDGETVHYLPVLVVDRDFHAGIIDFDVAGTTLWVASRLTQTCPLSPR